MVEATSSNQETNALKEYIKCLNKKIKLLEANKSKAIFKKPTTQEIDEYCKQRNNNIDANKFFDYYESIGWKVGKSSMKDWKAAVRNWEKNNNSYNQSSKPQTTIQETDREARYEEYLRQKEREGRGYNSN